MTPHRPAGLYEELVTRRLEAALERNVSNQAARATHSCRSVCGTPISLRNLAPTTNRQLAYPVPPTLEPCHSSTRAIM